MLSPEEFMIPEVLERLKELIRNDDPIAITMIIPFCMACAGYYIGRYSNDPSNFTTFEKILSLCGSGMNEDDNIEFWRYFSKLRPKKKRK